VALVFNVASSVGSMILTGFNPQRHPTHLDQLRQQRHRQRLRPNPIHHPQRLRPV
jgi:hypothetical protein